MQEFGLPAKRCIFVLGAHDERDLREAHDWRDEPDGLKDGEGVKQGDIILARNAEKYLLRLKPSSDSIFHKFVQRPCPLDSAAQGLVIPFWQSGDGGRPRMTRMARIGQARCREGCSVRRTAACAIAA